MGVILASSSPRRADLLRSIGLEFSVLPGAEIDERKVLKTAVGGLEQRLKRLAQVKCEGVARESPSELVLAADTVVVINGDVLGKPRDVDDAREMLMQLSGRTHHVLTAVAAQWDLTGFLETGVETTRVTFDLLDRQVIDRYIARDEPFDKAGAYAIQGLGALLVRKIEGDYSNVVGMPLPLTARLLTAAGLMVL